MWSCGSFQRRRRRASWGLSRQNTTKTTREEHRDDGCSSFRAEDHSRDDVHVEADTRKLGNQLAIISREEVVMNWRDTDIGSDCRCRAAGAMTSAIAMVTRRIAARWSIRSAGDN